MLRYLLLLLLLPALAAAENQPAARCASPGEADRVRTYYADQEKAPATLMAARRLGIPEAVVATSLPADLVYSIGGAHFREVWKTMEAWEDATFIVTKGAHVFEIQGPVHAGEDSTRSKFFNLEYGVGGVGGHLRPDTIASIHAVSMRYDDGDTLGIVFADETGDSPFAVYLTRESEPPNPAKRELFGETWELVRSKPPACN